MSNQSDETDETGGSTDEHSWIPEASRRRVIKFGGAAAAAATLGGAGMVAGQQDDGEDGDGSGDDGGDGESAGSDAVLDDLVDPTFGYPLAADETDGVTVEHVVDVTAREGEGDHPQFPSEPDQDAPGSFIEIPVEFLFDPVGLQIEPGDLVQFVDVNGLHTVTAFTELAEPELEVPRRVPEGVEPFTSPPLTPGQSWVYEFTEPGVYDYLCLPHLGLGMVGRIVVIDPEEDDVSDDTFSVPGPEGLFPNDRRVLTAPELEPANVVEQGTVAWADLSLGEPSPTETEAGTETEAEGETETETEAGTETETAAEDETETTTADDAGTSTGTDTDG